MKARARIAMALSMLLLLVSTAVADAAKPVASGATSITVGSWSYCKLDATHDVIRATDVEVSGLRKYSLAFLIDTDAPVVPDATGRKIVTLERAIGTVAADQVWHRVYIVASTQSWPDAARTGQGLSFQGGAYSSDCP